MRRMVISLILAAPLALAPLAHAQETPGASHLEIGGFPIGAIFFTNSSAATEPDFGNFALGATVTYRFNRWIGVEGEAGNALGRNQQMRVANVAVEEEDRQSPTLYAYSGNVVVHPTGSSGPLVPYFTAGLGGITLIGSDDVAALQITDNVSYLTGNLGGGTKWYLNRHWGLRADYRLVIVNNKADAPEFFGRDSVRYGHRVYGGLLFSR